MRLIYFTDSGSGGKYKVNVISCPAYEKYVFSGAILIPSTLLIVYCLPLADMYVFLSILHH
jgi:hypothetical protein